MSASLPRPAATRRLFYAWWPDEAARQALVSATRDAVAAAGGVPVPAGNLHVTLAFLGQVPPARLAALTGIGAGCRLPGAMLQLPRLECWRRPGVLAAVPDIVPAAGQALVDWLWQQLEEAGFPRDPRSWRPHLTLARRVRSLPEGAAMTPVAWQADRLALVESRRESGLLRYVQIAEWRLWMPAS